MAEILRHPGVARWVAASYTGAAGWPRAVLDEPTASLDPATEDALLTGHLTGPSTGTVTVVSSHRLATVRAAYAAMHAYCYRA